MFYLLFLFTQTVDADELQNILATERITVYGLMVVFLGILLFVVYKLWKKVNELNEARLNDSKEYTDLLLKTAKEANDTIKQLTEFLKG